MPTPIEELEGRYRCRHLVSGNECGLAGQESKCPTMAQEGFGGEKPICRLARSVANGTECNSCHIRCGAVAGSVRRALRAEDPALRDGTVKNVLKNACCGWEPKPPVSNRLPGGGAP